MWYSVTLQRFDRVLCPFNRTSFFSVLEVEVFLCMPGMLSSLRSGHREDPLGHELVKL